MIIGGSFMINNQKISDVEFFVTKENGVEGKVFIIRKGKKKYYLGIYED